MATRADVIMPKGGRAGLGSRRPRSLTLVEVLAALVLLGGSVTTMLVAQSTSMERIQTCERQLTAGHVAKELLVMWRLGQENLEIPARGDVAGAPGWSWSRTAQQRQIAEGVTVVEVTLDVIYSSSDARDAPWVRSYRWLIKNDRQAQKT